MWYLHIFVFLCLIYFCETGSNSTEQSDEVTFEKKWVGNNKRRANEFLMGDYHIGGRSCKDSTKSCSQWKSYCSSAKWGAWMRKKCAKTCNTCGGPDQYSQNVEDLTGAQTGHLLEAMRKTQSSSGWERVVSLHGDPVRPECSHEFCCDHSAGGGFLPWHRLYVDFMNEEIQRLDPAVVMPYWDWTTSEIPAIANSPQIENPQTGQSMDNPFYRGFIGYQQKYTDRALNNVTTIDTEKHLRDVMTALEEDDFLLFSLQLQFAHNDIHDYIGGDMFTLERSSYDPIFFMHHSFVDLIWAVYQILKPNSFVPTQVLQQIQIPWDLTAEQTLPLPSRYNLDMGSDRVVFGGMTLKQIKEELIKRKKDKIYAGFFFRSFRTSGRIHFNICILDDCSYPGGDVVIFGGEREKYYANPYPFKIDVTDELNNAGVTNLTHVRFNVTSFEALGGPRTPLEIFQPIRIVREGQTGKYHYCIFLDGIHPQPPLIKAPTNCGVRIESEHGKFYASDEESNYYRCKKSGEHVTPLDSGKEMDLPSGTYFFYDDECKSQARRQNVEVMGKLKIEMP